MPTARDLRESPKPQADRSDMIHPRKKTQPELPGFSKRADSRAFASGSLKRWTRDLLFKAKRREPIHGSAYKLAALSESQLESGESSEWEPNQSLPNKLKRGEHLLCALSDLP